MKKLAPWLGVLLILIIVFGTIYGVVQQAQRSEANYPQIQLAEDAAAALNRGEPPAGVVAGAVNMQTSLAPFIVIYDKHGRPLAGSGYLNGRLPDAPLGILTRATGQDYYAITWQPKSDIRVAAVTAAAHDYYVLSGRSLKEVERNESRSFTLSLLGGMLAAALLAIGYTASRRGRT